MSCSLCENIVERSDIPHVIRVCDGCGREMHIVEPGEHGRGLQIRQGDRVVIPAGSIRISANPLKSTGILTQSGLDWFAKQVFIQGYSVKSDNFLEELEALEKHTDEILVKSEMLAGLDISNPEHGSQVFQRLQQEQDSIEWWAALTGIFTANARSAFSESNFENAMTSLASAERCRAMVVFKENFQDVVWMGHSAWRITAMLKLWSSHMQNSDEEFWQITFNENTYVLSQVFAVPVIFIKDKAYVGGMKLDSNDGRFVDYLFSAESSREAILIELKTPVSKLMGAKYRKGVYSPSSDLSGAVAQALQYRSTLVQNLQSLNRPGALQLEAFSPKCVLIVGNAEQELIDPYKRRSFEIYRSSMRDIEIITFDELFRKVAILAELFGLVVKRAQQP